MRHDWLLVGGGASRPRVLFRRWALVRRPAAPERKEGCRPGANCSERLESRGEIRGGRFVSGFSGEQFALPEAIGMLRATRRADQWVSVSGADPLNLVGILTSGPRLPALAGNRLSYRDGIPTAVLIADDIQFLEAFDDATEWTAQKELLRSSSEPSVTKGAPSSSHRVVKKNRLKASTFAAQFDIRLRNRLGNGKACAQCPPRCSTDPRDVVCTRSTG